MVVSVVLKPVHLHVANERRRRLPRVERLIIPFPTNFPLVLALPKSVAKNLLHHIGVILGNIPSGSVIMKLDLLSIDGREIQLESVSMDILDTHWQSNLVTGGVIDSREYLTRSGPQRVQLVSLMG
jgi:hypothetical protein